MFCDANSSHIWLSSNHRPNFMEDQNSGLAVEEAKPKLKPPPMYRVILLNDDYTPALFVVDILMMFFGMSQEKATQVMSAVHHQGRGVCGVFPKDVAQTKAMQVNQYAREHQHPLLSEVEVAD